MRRHRFDPEDSAKPYRTPKNLLNYIRDQSPSDDLMQLLAKHNKNIKKILDDGSLIPDISNSKFILDLNNFNDDLIKISNLCYEIDLDLRSRQEHMLQSRSLLQKYDSKKLIEMVSCFYIEAKNYDAGFDSREWRPRIGGRPMLLPLSLFFNPFRHNANISNEENIFNLVESFKTHDAFLKNFINTFYSDGKDGEDYIGKKFEEISSKYLEIKNIISELSKLIPKTSNNQSNEKLKRKYLALERILDKHPATLYSATKNILSYLEKSVPVPA